MALSHLISAFGADEALAIASRLLPSMSKPEAKLIARQIERRINCPLTSSMGRFFDAVAALLGATPEATYEGQPAMELEALAGAPSPNLERGIGGEAPVPNGYTLADGVIDTRPILRTIVEDLQRGVERELIAARFHESVAAFTAEACRLIRGDGGPSEVVLSGGVMQNALLVSRLLELLPAAGLRCRTHKEVPPNDGGMSLGQAIVAASIEMLHG
jgi:hydrogenase maturation protein HypF